MSDFTYHDPFQAARAEQPAIATEFDGAPVAMILGFKEVREAARDWEKFSSDAPFRVPIPREEDVRTVRQYPLEVDPPIHAQYRKIAEPFFNRPTQPEYIERMGHLIEELLTDAMARDSIEIVREFAIPLQSRALTYLLNMPESEAGIWIGWGTHVFRDASGVSKGGEMEAYSNELFDRAQANPGDDFFSALTQATFDGRPLTRDEMQGFANIAFAGGRDTIINTVSTILAYFAAHPASLDELRDEPKKVVVAGEELIRYATPLTHIGRLCPVDTDVYGVEVKADHLISLCWASANFDDTVFDNPETVKLDRKPNPHISFGQGIHNCMGAAHARLIVRTLLTKLSALAANVTLISETRNIETEAAYTRANAYEELTMNIVAR